MKKTINSLKEYISEEFINEVIKLIKFLLIYTIIFLILVGSFKYAVPFVIALIIAVIIKPIKIAMLKYFRKCKKIKVTNELVSFLLTFTVVIISLLIIIGILYVIIAQSEKFLIYITNPDTIDTTISKTENWISNILSKIKTIDPNIMSRVKKVISEIITIVTNTVSILGKKLLSFAISIPSVIISIFITLISTYFFIKDIEVIQEKTKKIFSKKGLEFISDIKKKMNNVTGGYIKAYTLIMLSIATMSFIIFSIAKVEYALPIALLTAVLDLLPIIGAGLIYGILIISMYLAGKTINAVILLIGFIIVAIVRQVLEQNLVASFIGVHPLMMIIALFIALTPLGFIGMFYFLGAIIIYDMI